MKRRQAALLGNIIIIMGLVIMVAGMGYSILTQLPQLDMPKFFANGAVFGIFIGAIFWLVGARIGGRERISDRYWWVRHFDKRCRRESQRHS